MNNEGGDDISIFCLSVSLWTDRQTLRGSDRLLFVFWDEDGFFLERESSTFDLQDTSDDHLFPSLTSLLYHFHQPLWADVCTVSDADSFLALHLHLLLLFMHSL